MDVSLYIADPWCELSIADLSIHIDRLLRDCPVLQRADWHVAAGTTAKVMFSELFTCDCEYTSLLRPDHMSMCLLPVYLALQRDTFSLQHVARLTSDNYVTLTQQLKTHFAQIFMIEPDAQERCWWIKPVMPVTVYSPWPQECLYQQAISWQPQGIDAPIMRSWINEMQMLIHQLSADGVLQDSTTLFNSVWIAHAGPDTPALRSSLSIGGIGQVFTAIQRLSPAQSSVTTALEAGSEHFHYIADSPTEIDWTEINHLLARGQIRQLRLCLPFAEQHVQVTWHAAWRWQCWRPQFWRQQHSVDSLMQTLTAALAASKPSASFMS